MQNRLWSCVTHYRAFVTGCNRLSVFGRHMIQNPASKAQPQSCKTIWRQRLASIAPITIDESPKERTLWPYHNSKRRHASILIRNPVKSLKSTKNFCRMSGVITFSAFNIEGMITPLKHGQTHVGITPTNLMPPRSSGFRTTNNPTTKTSINLCKSPSNAIATAK